MARLRELCFRGVRVRELGAELGKVHFLRVGAALGVFFQDHRPREILDGFFDHVVQDVHHRDGLGFVEAFGFEAADEFEGVEVMILLGAGGVGEGTAGGFEDVGVDAVVPYWCGCWREGVAGGKAAALRCAI